MEPNKSYQIAEIALVYNTPKDFNDRPKAGSSKEAYNILLHSWEAGRIELLEEFKILFLNRANKIIGLYELSKGGTYGVIVDIKLVATAALKLNASKIILAHNHPGGTLFPSDEDIKVTKKIKAACNLIDISVVDHLIITVDGYYSFADNGGL